MKVYVVEALRYGNRERHSYVLGVFQDVFEAAKVAVAHEYWRGGKYECAIIEHILDEYVQEEIDFCKEKCLPKGEFEMDVMVRANEVLGLYDE
jgi:hypothetical protein